MIRGPQKPRQGNTQSLDKYIPVPNVCVRVAAKPWWRKHSFYHQILYLLLNGFGQVVWVSNWYECGHWHYCKLHESKNAIYTATTLCISWSCTIWVVTLSGSVTLGKPHGREGSEPSRQLLSKDPGRSKAARTHTEALPTENLPHQESLKRLQAPKGSSLTFVVLLLSFFSLWSIGWFLPLLVFHR